MLHMCRRQCLPRRRRCCYADVQCRPRLPARIERGATVRGRQLRRRHGACCMQAVSRTLLLPDWRHLADGLSARLLLPGQHVGCSGVAVPGVDVLECFKPGHCRRVLALHCWRILSCGRPGHSPALPQRHLCRCRRPLRLQDLHRGRLLRGHRRGRAGRLSTRLDVAAGRHRVLTLPSGLLLRDPRALTRRRCQLSWLRGGIAVPRRHRRHARRRALCMPWRQLLRRECDEPHPLRGCHRQRRRRSRVRALQKRNLLRRPRPQRLQGRIARFLYDVSGAQRDDSALIARRASRKR